MPDLQRQAIVFDLDDTLYPEMAFLKSGYRYIARTLSKSLRCEPIQIEHALLEWYAKQANPFQQLLSTHPELGMSVGDLVTMYREHPPTISPYPGVTALLKQLKHSSSILGLITDGHSMTQRNKLKALGVIELFDVMIISGEFGTEKPCVDNYRAVERFSPNGQYVYIGDNYRKDFVTPNRLGWTTIALKDQGQNVHSQRVDVEAGYHPQYVAEDIHHLTQLLCHNQGQTHQKHPHQLMDSLLSDRNAG